MKYVAALALLAVPLALSAAPAEAHVRDGYRCHFVKNVVYKHGRKHLRFTKVCRRKHGFNKHHARRHVRHVDRRYDRR